MNFTMLLLCVFASRTLAVTEGEPSQEIANEESFVPVGDSGEAVIELNRTSYKLDNISRSGNHIAGDLGERIDPQSLLHPNFWTYCIHTVAQIIVTILAVKAPKVLLCVLVAAVLCWPLSWIFNEPIWGMKPGDSTWWLMAVKSVIVNVAPTAPMLICLINRPSPKVSHRVGVWGYCVLWANVFWTLFFLPLAFNPVSVTNAVCAISLCISLVLHNIALCKKGVALCEVKGKFFYGYGTSLSWLVCYTVWNGLFVVECAVGLVFQDIAFWAVMYVFYYWSNCRTAIENYFAMARPISLSTYIASSDWPGFHNFFRNAPPLSLDVTGHAFFLFLAAGNVLFSFYVLYWAVCCLLESGGAEEYFMLTLKVQEATDIEVDSEESSE